MSFLFFTILFISQLSAQTADEIVSKYFENTGGIENWRNVKSIRYKGIRFDRGYEIPFEAVKRADGRRYFNFIINGDTLRYNGFDGEVLWKIDYQSRTHQLASQEATANAKQDANDFPHALLDYKKKGYTIVLEGITKVGDEDAYKLKLQKENQTIDGKEVEDISYYYFDRKDMMIVQIEELIKTGPEKGNYRLIDDLLFSHIFYNGSTDEVSLFFSFDSFKINPEVDERLYKIPN